MTDPKTPAEALRWVAWSIGSCARLPFSTLDADMANAMIGDIVAEAARLEALPPPTHVAGLSPSANARATDAITTAVRQFSGVQLLSDDVNSFHEQLRLRGLAIVEVKP